MDEELLTVKGMCNIMFPVAAALVEKEQEAAAGEEGEAASGAAGQQKRKRDKVTLHSTQLWPLKGGATGEECFNLVKEMTEAKRAKEAKTAENKVARAQQAKQNRVAQANDLGAQVAGKLRCRADVSKLKVDELKAALSFKGVAFSKTLKKAELAALALQELKLPEIAPAEEPEEPSAVGSAELEVDPSAFIDSDEDSEEDDESDEDDYSG